MSSLFKWSSSTSAAPEDAPLDALPAAERSGLAELSARFSSALASSDLGADDAWRHLTARQTDELCLRFLRLHNLQVDKADAQIRRVVAWRAAQQPATWRLKDVQGRHVGIPLAVLDARGLDDELLIYAPVQWYVRSAVDHAAQETGVKALFEQLVYARDGRQARCGIMIVDFEALSYRNVDLVATKNGIGIFINYYPEVMKRILFVNFPKFMKGVWKMIVPLLDTRTVNRVQWHSSDETIRSELDKYFAKSQLPTWLGGDVADEHDPQVLLFTGDKVKPSLHL